MASKTILAIVILSSLIFSTLYNNQQEMEMNKIQSIKVLVRVKPESRDEFILNQIEIGNDFRQIQGCINFEFSNDLEDPNRFITYIEFDSEESYKRYRNSGIGHKINTMLFPLHDGMPSYRHYESKILDIRN